MPSLLNRGCATSRQCARLILIIPRFEIWLAIIRWVLRLVSKCSAPKWVCVRSILFAWAVVGLALEVDLARQVVQAIWLFATILPLVPTWLPLVNRAKLQLLVLSFRFDALRKATMNWPSLPNTGISIDASLEGRTWSNWRRLHYKRFNLLLRCLLLLCLNWRASLLWAESFGASRGTWQRWPLFFV